MGVSKIRYFCSAHSSANSYFPTLLKSAYRRVASANPNSASKISHSAATIQGLRTSWRRAGNKEFPFLLFSTIWQFPSLSSEFRINYPFRLEYRRMRAPRPIIFSRACSPMGPHSDFKSAAVRIVEATPRIPPVSSKSQKRCEIFYWLGNTK